MTEEDWARRQDEFRLLDGETLAGVLAEYETVAAATDDLVRTLPDLGATQPLPSAPWFPSQQRWSARRVLLHIIAETAQHAGTPTSSASRSTARRRWADRSRGSRPPSAGCDGFRQSTDDLGQDGAGVAKFSRTWPRPESPQSAPSVRMTCALARKKSAGLAAPSPAAANRSRQSSQPR